MRTREGKNRSYQNGTLRGGQQFTRQIRQQQQSTDLDVDDRYLSHEEDKMHQLAGYFEARYRATTERIPLFEQPDIASVRMKRRLMELRAQGSQFDGRGSSSRWSSLDGGGSALLPAQEAAVGLGGHYLGHSLSLANLSSATKVSVASTCVVVVVAVVVVVVLVVVGLSLCCFAFDGAGSLNYAYTLLSFAFFILSSKMKTNKKCKVPVNLYPEDRLISGRLRKEDEKKMKEEHAKIEHHEKFGVFGSSIEMPNAEELAAPIPLGPLLGEWASGVPEDKKRLKDLFRTEDETMQGALRYAARKEHSTLTAELSNLQ